MPHAEINGAQIYYELHGQGFPLVLAHLDNLDLFNRTVEGFLTEVEGRV